MNSLIIQGLPEFLSLPTYHLWATGTRNPAPHELQFTATDAMTIFFILMPCDVDHLLDAISGAQHPKAMKPRRTTCMRSVCEGVGFELEITISRCVCVFIFVPARQSKASSCLKTFDAQRLVQQV